MRRQILNRDFFDRLTVGVARDLLGQFLVRRYRGREMAYMITEVEVYDSLKDRGSHASRGQTQRNFPMFGPAGRWYVYFTYGMHWMLNIVTREKGYPAAVLIRGVESASGPARVTKKLKINKKFNDLPAAKKTGLWLEDRGVKINRVLIKRGPRIGIGYAGPYWAKRRLRFWID